jgi:hypothetical protein
MISGSAATSATNTTRGTLSYVNNVITGATSEGKYTVFIDEKSMDDNMSYVLSNTYGYNITKKTDLMGTFTNYKINWGEPAESSGTILFNGLDPQDGGSYVSAPGSTITTWLPGTGNFTVEWFQYQTQLTAHPRVFSIGPDTTPKYGVSIESNNIYTWPGGNSYAIGKTYQNTWIHVALVRTTGTTKCYIDGTQVGTAQANAVTITGSTYDLYIGSDGISAGDGFPGKITNFRWTNSVVYSGNFTKPSSPLTVLPQTKLLLLGGSPSNPVVDSTGINSLTNFNTTWGPDSPFY